MSVHRRKRALFFLLFGSILLNPAVGIASSPYESEINKITVSYSNGSSIAVICNVGPCNVQVLLDGKIYRFMSSDLEGEAIASRPILYSENNAYGKFSFEVKLDCEKSGFPSSVRGICVANYSVEGGRIKKVNKFELRSGVVYPLRK